MKKAGFLRFWDEMVYLMRNGKQKKAHPGLFSEHKVDFVFKQDYAKKGFLERVKFFLMCLF
ncbi:MAG: hypothetical protein Q4Q37_05405 [Methanobrevibacter sp.]|nr:hypothetical protein [Methanobrevibacter sp.]